MGKKVKKKARSGHKEKSKSEAVEEVVAVKGRKICVHFDNGVDLAKVTQKIGFSEPIKCDDCREGFADRRAGKGKGKHGKKRESGSADLRPEYRAIWVCLECGHFSCGGIGFPTTPQSHAVRHAKQYRHPLAVQFENPNLRWCFPCSTLTPLEKSEEDGECKDLISDIVKLIKGKSSQGASLDVSFGNGSLTSEIKSGSIVSGNIDGTSSYMVRGLSNLGNTCFFNSTVQNLLAIGRLRDYFLELEESVGPLTVALKKLYDETVPESGLRNVINPRSFFGCLCAKAPQFRGYQQHDSHELLRCLLDGLSTEESSAIKKLKSSQENGTTKKLDSTFVDAVFGGQLSSTVCCLECGHSSTVYEPFLDLSLPVPMKKPSSRKVKPISGVKTSKVPPKKSVRVRSKVNRDRDSTAAQSDSTLPISGTSSCPGQSNLPPPETMAASSSVSVSSDCNGPNIAANEMGNASQNISLAQESGDEQCSENFTKETVASTDILTWLDFLEPDTTLDNHEVASIANDDSVERSSGGKDANEVNVFVEKDLKSTSQNCSTHMMPNEKVDSLTNSLENERPLQVQSSEVLLLPYKEESSTNGETNREGEVSSSGAGNEKAFQEFDGFGDLFNEPEVAEATISNPLSNDGNFQNQVPESGVIAGNISESDPDEIDNSDSPVSIDSCLTCFTKPELLTNEHGWHCENCSKVLRLQRINLKKSKQNKTRMNVGSIQNDALHAHKDCHSPSEVRNYHTGNINRDDFCTSNDISNAKINNNETDVLETSQIAEPKPVSLQKKAERSQKKDVLPELSQSSSSYKTSRQVCFSDQSNDSCSANEYNDAGQNMENFEDTAVQFSGQYESEDSEDDDVDSASVKLKRDASKRFLINSAPPILTIHLKRFSQDTRGRLSKLNGHVDFRETIDLRPYMDPRTREREEHKYQLVGVVEHLGSMRGGHYVAYVRGGRSRNTKKKCDGDSIWYHASDAHVHEVSLEEVLGCEAYILFYERI